MLIGPARMCQGSTGLAEFEEELFVSQTDDSAGLHAEALQVGTQLRVGIRGRLLLSSFGCGSRRHYDVEFPPSTLAGLILKHLPSLQI
jgi:hypothetical protein